MESHYCSCAQLPSCKSNPWTVPYRAQGDGNFEDRLDELLDAALAGMQDAAQIRHGYRQPRTTDVCTDVVGNLGPGDVTAVAAGAAMRLVLGHVHGKLRQLDNLMPARLRVIRPRQLRQVVITDFAHIGHVVLDRLGQAFRRQTLAQVGVMSGLATGLAARRLLANGRRRLRRIGRWRHRRVGRIPVKTRFQFANARLQFLDPLEQQATSWTARLIHAEMVAKGAAGSCASLGR